MAYGRRSIKGIVLEIGGDTSQLSTAINDAYKDVSALDGELRKVERGLRLDPKNAAFNRQNIEVTKSAIEETEKKLRLLEEAQRKAAEAKTLDPAKYREIERQVELTKKRLDDLNQSLNDQTSRWKAAGDAMKAAGDKLKNAGQKMQNTGRTLTRNITAPLAAISGLSVKAAIDFESAMIGVRKTTDLTDEEFERMSQGIRNMAREIPASTTAIAEVAEAAGQLGIEKDSILDFTRVIIDMGNATNLSAEQGAQQMARFANITSMSQKDFDRLGSTIVELGNNFATSESEIMDMAMRLAGAGAQAKMSNADILGIAAALSSLGLEAQAGGSAFSKAIAKIQVAVETGSGDLEDFAAIAGMSVSEFTRLWEEDAAGALNAFVMGLGDFDRHGRSATVLLDDLGIKELRLADAMKRTSGSQDLLNDAVKLGNEAWEDNTALAEEAEQRYKSTASQLEIQKNRLNDNAITLGQKLVPAMSTAIEWATNLIDKFNGMSESSQEFVIKAGLIAAAAGSVLSVTGKLTSGVGSFVGGIGKLAGAIGAKGGLIAAITGTGGMLAALGLLAGAAALYRLTVDDVADNVRRLKAEKDKASDAMRTNIQLYKDNATEAFVLIGRIEELQAKEKLSVTDKAELEGAVRRLRDLYPELGLEIDETTGKLKNETEAIKDLITEIVRRQLVEEYSDEIIANIQRRREAVEQLTRAEEALSEHAEKASKADLSDRYQFTLLGPHSFKKFEDDVSAAKALIAEIDADNRRLGESIANVNTEVQQHLGRTVTIHKASQEEIRDAYRQHNEALRADTKTQQDHIKEAYSQHHQDLINHHKDSETEIERNQWAVRALRSALVYDYWDHKEKIEEAARQLRDSLFDINKESLVNQETTAKQARDNLRKQIDEYRAWRDNMRLLAAMVPPEVLAELEKLGPGQSVLINDLVNGTEEDLQEFIDLWIEAGVVSRETVVEELGEIPPWTRRITGEVTDAFRAEQIKTKQEAEKQALAAKKGLEEGSKGAGSTGGNMSRDFASGIRGAGSTAYEGGKLVGGRGLRGARDGSSGGWGVGRDLVSGVDSGLRSQAKKLYEQAKSIMRQTISSMRQVAAIRSPSREGIDIGANLIGSVGLGMIGNLSAAERSATEAMQSLLGRMRGAGDQIGLGWADMAGELKLPETALSNRQIFLQIDTVHVREDADIDRIVTELERRVMREERVMT